MSNYCERCGSELTDTEEEAISELEIRPLCTECMTEVFTDLANSLVKIQGQILETIAPAMQTLAEQFNQMDLIETEESEE